MVLKETISEIQRVLAELIHDLEKAAGGNRAAAQRVRTGTIKFTKIAKIYRKESVAAERVPKRGKKLAKKVVGKKR